jgi:hypothetical protein
MTSNTARTWKTADEIASLFWNGGKERARQHFNEPRFDLGLSAKQVAWLQGQFERENCKQFNGNAMPYSGILLNEQGQEIGSWDLHLYRRGGGCIRVNLF